MKIRRRQLISLLAVLTRLFVGFCLCPHSVRAQQTPAEPCITVEFNDTPFRVALHELFQQAGIPYRVDKEAETFLASDYSPFYDSKITLSLKEVSLPDALHRLMHFTNGTDRPLSYLTYQQREGTYVFTLGSGLPDEKVTLNLLHADLVDAFKQACAQVHASYVVNLEGCSPPPVTLTVKEMPFGEVVTRLLAAAQVGAGYEFQTVSGIAVIGRSGRLYMQEPPPVHPLLQDKIWVHLEPNENLYTVFNAVLRSLSIGFNLDPFIRLTSTTAMTRHLPAKKMVLTLMRSSQAPLRFTIERDVVSIYDKRSSKIFYGH